MGTGWGSISVGSWRGSVGNGRELMGTGWEEVSVGSWWELLGAFGFFGSFAFRLFPAKVPFSPDRCLLSVSEGQLGWEWVGAVAGQIVGRGRALLGRSREIEPKAVRIEPQAVKKTL